jgi:hypothetical protein
MQFSFKKEKLNNVAIRKNYEKGKGTALETCSKQFMLVLI